MATTLLDRIDIDDDLTRRRLLGVGGGLTAGVLIGGCADDELAAPPGPAPTPTGPFPVTVPHQYGDTIVPAEPKRVVTVGVIEQDALLALGIVPVGTTQWLGEPAGGIYAWARERLGGAALPQELTDADGIEFERVAALAPDLIIAVYSDLSEQDYGTLAAIAPTVAPPAGYAALGVPWQEVTRVVGRAVGRPARAEEVIAEVEGRFARVRAGHRQFAGASALNLYFTPDGAYQVYPPPDLGGRLLADLGFAAPQKILDAAGGAASVDLSAEQVGLLEVDALVWLVFSDAEREQIRAQPLYAALDIAMQGREVFLNYETDHLSEAMSVQTVLSLPFLLDGLVPLLVAALDGDPATTAEPAIAAGDASIGPTASASPGPS